jgi:F0F1-type ATP synthase assembly protein I
MLPPMEPAAPRPFPPIEAGALLVLVTGLGLALGAVVGWAAGSVGPGLIIGAVIGLPAGVFAVYRRYRGYFR